MKLHLGCGEIYLRDWVNVDAVGDLATENPTLAEEKATDLANYYRRPYNKQLLGHDKRSRNVVDLHAVATRLPLVDDGTVDEILMVNLLDHLRLQDLPAAVAEWRRVLKPGGQLIVDVGDVKATAQLLVDAVTTDEFEWALRLLYCHSRDLYDSHHWGYTPDYLNQILTRWGFTQLWTRRDYITHVYPNFQSCFTKVD